MYINTVLEPVGTTAAMTIKAGSIVITVGTGAGEHVNGNLKDVQVWSQSWDAADVSYHWRRSQQPRRNGFVVCQLPDQNGVAWRQLCGAGR
jgi:hypothetical protein